MLRSLKRSLLSAAQTKADLELQSTADLGLALVKTMVAAEAKSHPDTTDRDWRMGLGALSMDQGAQHVLKGLIQAGAMERLKLEHVYDAEMAAERTKKKAGEGGGSVGAPPAQSAT